MVPSDLIEHHHRWHEETDEKIDGLTKRVQEIEASYGDQ